MGSSSASWREQKATGCYAKRIRGRDVDQQESKNVAVTTCNQRMHSHNRCYSVDARLTCERSPFERNSMIAIADHLRLNVMELACFVKEGGSCDHDFLKLQIADLLYTHDSSSISMWRAGYTKSGFCQAIMRKPYSCDATASSVQKFTKLTSNMSVYIMVRRDNASFRARLDGARLYLNA